MACIGAPAICNVITSQHAANSTSQSDTHLRNFRTADLVATELATANGVHESVCVRPLEPRPDCGDVISYPSDRPAVSRASGALPSAEKTWLSQRAPRPTSADHVVRDPLPRGTATIRLMSRDYKVGPFFAKWELGAWQHQRSSAAMCDYSLHH